MSWLTSSDLESLLIASSGVFGALVVSAYPIMRLVRVLTQTSKENARDSSEKTLYDQLSNQIDTLSKSLDQARKESSELLSEVGVLKNRVISLEGFEANYIILKQKLDQKDAEILSYQNKIYALTRELEKTKVHLTKYETIPMPTPKPKPDPQITLI